ncbi:MAG: Purine nucleoside phosphorylase DeoD-type [Promethearchaeota archaeon]|nr:MAG: Purine nucleoside phosphorylase DeoD-type [Candidatus Lokiarchaeota archaeon]
MINRIKSELINLGLKFINNDEKIVRIFLETAPTNVNEIVILPTTKLVMKKILNKLENKNKKGYVYNGIINGVRVSVIRCQMGCPNMAILMEVLKRTKANKAIRIDFCGGMGGLQNNVQIGDVIIPKKTYCGDGTSPQYILTNTSLSTQLKSINNPRGQFQNLIAGQTNIYLTSPNESISSILYTKGKALYELKVKRTNLWTTDALFCETQEFLRTLSSIEVEAVDMESSIMFLMGILSKIQTSAILAVSDLPGTEHDFILSNQIHPEMESGINRAIKILINSLPEIKSS